MIQSSGPPYSWSPGTSGEGQEERVRRASEEPRRTTQSDDMSDLGFQRNALASEMKVEGSNPSTGFQFPGSQRKELVRRWGRGAPPLEAIGLRSRTPGPLRDPGDVQHSPHPHLETGTEYRVGLGT